MSVLPNLPRVVSSDGKLDGALPPTTPLLDATTTRLVNEPAHERTGFVCLGHDIVQELQNKVVSLVATQTGGVSLLPTPKRGIKR